MARQTNTKCSLGKHPLSAWITHTSCTGQATPSHSSIYLSLPCFCTVKALLDLTDVQKMQLHSWRVVILSREYSERHSLQVSKGARANSPASDSSAVMVWGQAFPAEPIHSLMVHSAWKDKSTAEISHEPRIHFSLTWVFTSQIHKSTSNVLLWHLGASLTLQAIQNLQRRCLRSHLPKRLGWVLREHSPCWHKAPQLGCLSSN